MAHVLIVGGDPSTRLFLCSVCAGHGWIVATATDAQAIVCALRARPIDLILVVVTDDDHELLNLVAAWRRVIRLAPLVALVPGDATELHRRAFSLGAEDVIGWPADARVVGVRLGVILRHTRRDVLAPSRRASVARAAP